MAFNDDATLIATYGTLFYAPVGTLLPKDGAKGFKLNSDTIPSSDNTGGTDPKKVWTNLGHTSADNKISFSFDGGDATSHNSWARKNHLCGFDLHHHREEPPVGYRHVEADLQRCR